MWSTLFLQTCKQKKREAVDIPLPISMHTGQLILMAKVFAEVDLGFYDFTNTKAVLTSKPAP
jgi:hypothetical protein